MKSTIRFLLFILSAIMQSMGITAANNLYKEMYGIDALSDKDYILGPFIIHIKRFVLFLGVCVVLFEFIGWRPHDNKDADTEGHGKPAIINNRIDGGACNSAGSNGDVTCKEVIIQR